MTITTHMCRGNFRSSWVAPGRLRLRRRRLFNELVVDGYFMEFDDERSGGSRRCVSCPRQVRRFSAW